MPASPPSAEPARRPWRPSLLILATLALHLGALVLLIARPGLWPYLLSAVIANHLLVTAAGLWPRSRLLGPNLTRLPAASPAACVALTIDDGPDPQVTPGVLALLEAHGVRATFFCIGSRVREHPELAREICARGHEIGNHTEQHLMRFSLLGPHAMAREVAAAQETLAAVTGQTPRFFRAPAGLRNPFLEPLLARLDLRLVSWTRRGFDTVSGDASRVLARLTRRLGAGDILLLHDGHAARTASGAPVILAVLPPLLEQLRARGLRAVTLRAAFADAHGA